MRDTCKRWRHKQNLFLKKGYDHPKNRFVKGKLRQICTHARRGIIFACALHRETAAMQYVAFALLCCLRIIFFESNAAIPHGSAHAHARNFRKFWACSARLGLDAAIETESIYIYSAECTEKTIAIIPAAYFGAGLASRAAGEFGVEEQNHG